MHNYYKNNISQILYTKKAFIFGLVNDIEDDIRDLSDEYKFGNQTLIYSETDAQRIYKLNEIIDSIDTIKEDGNELFKVDLKERITYVDQYLNYTTLNMTAYEVWFKWKFAGFYDPIKLNLLVSKINELNDIYMQKYTYL